MDSYERYRVATYIIRIKHSNHCENKISWGDGCSLIRQVTNDDLMWCDVCKSYLLCVERQSSAARAPPPTFTIIHNPAPDSPDSLALHSPTFYLWDAGPDLLINFLFISIVLTNFIGMVLILPCVVWPRIKLSFPQIKVVKSRKIGVRLSEQWAFNLSWLQGDPLVRSFRSLFSFVL